MRPDRDRRAEAADDAGRCADTADIADSILVNSILIDNILI